MGSGTTQAVAMKLGRRFIGADINLGAIQTTTKRLVGVANELNSQMQEETKYTGFEVYNVNNYDFFRNPAEARDLLIQALEIQPFPQSNVWDGELDGRMVKSCLSTALQLKLTSKNFWQTCHMLLMKSGKKKIRINPWNT